MKYKPCDLFYSILLLIPLLGPMIGFMIIMFKYESKSDLPSKDFLIAVSLPAIIFTIYFALLLLIYGLFEWNKDDLFLAFLFAPPTLFFDFLLVRFYKRIIRSIK